jgi:four helix bundle protein
MMMVEGDRNKGLMGKGYMKLIVWKNACELRRLIYNITKRFPLKEKKRVTQMQDSARSIKQNIQEGYKRTSIGEYIHHLSIAQGSLGELSGDVDDCFEDKLITREEYEILSSLINKTDYLFMRLIQSLEHKRRLSNG